MIIATLCGMGFGTSMLLKLTIDDVLKQEGITNYQISPWDLGSFKGQHADIVVAPTDMESHLKDSSATIVLIKNLVDKAEIKEKILAAVNSLDG
ncbi:MAG: PTS sugar transporter subunit IIB [Anaerolineales bacterium]|nr:PTS sugar transporter subunit IIB [Anaerolineales bacterium]MCK5635670.1 PTS sugar transporter subunit IIB [Anaerolineales bacterium]